MDTTRFSLRQLLLAARCDVSHMWGVKLAMVCILSTLLVCGCATAFPIPSTGDTVFRIDCDGGIGSYQGLQLNGIYYTTADGGYGAAVSSTKDWLYEYSKSKHAVQDVTAYDFNVPRPLTNESFSKVVLTMTLKRTCGLGGLCKRYDTFHIDVTNLCEVQSDKVVRIPLKVWYSYQCGKFDAVAIKDRDGNTLIRLGKGGDPGWYYHD